jgi:hypothetical protein
LQQLIAGNSEFEYAFLDATKVNAFPHFTFYTLVTDVMSDSVCKPCSSGSFPRGQ